ncbi:acyl-CoA thioesterase II [Gaopeijia maritima]|uniref:Acyl-CoA thioesterase II n=1 Tax=Gaopeijia maritima TaxID=3119007 RepID=A0ABU9E4G0_9BACT
MNFTSDDLIALLDLEPLEHNIYRGQNRDIGTKRIYGGQVLAQALVSAQRTVDADRPIHSMHGYFILAGDLSVPVVYFVDRLRDGGSFTTRRVTAIQHGQAIFNLSASFHRHEDGLAHQLEMPDVPPPEEVRPELDVIRERARSMPDKVGSAVTQDRPLDVRPVDDDDPFEPKVMPARRAMWVRTTGPLGDDPLHHQAVLAYASDYGLIVTALRPHARSVRDPEMMVASLDHSIWFHRPFRIDEWLLYVVDAPVSSGGRGFARGTYFTREGELVASTAQEGLMRVRTDRRT